MNSYFSRLNFGRERIVPLVSGSSGSLICAEDVAIAAKKVHQSNSTSNILSRQLISKSTEMNTWF